MNEWIEIGKHYGGLGVIVAALGFFLYLRVWPFVTKQIEEAQAARKTEIKEFVDTIRSRDVLMAEMQRETLKALEAVTAELRALREEVRTHR